MVEFKIVSVLSEKPITAVFYLNNIINKGNTIDLIYLDVRKNRKKQSLFASNLKVDLICFFLNIKKHGCIQVTTLL